MAHDNLGAALSALRKQQEEIDKSDDSLDPADFLEIRARKQEEEIAAFREAIRLQSDGPRAHYNLLALTHRQRGDKDEGRNWFGKAVTWTTQKSSQNIELRQLWSEAGEPLGETGPETLVAGSPAAAAPP